MVIKGLQRFSLLDYPGKISCIIFVAGCNFRCHFCHNRDLVLDSPQLPRIFHKEISAFLKKRIGQLDGVVITGGEPTLYPDLKDFISQIRQMGFLVKLDTNGSRPEMVENLVRSEVVNYWAMDIKGPLDDRYGKLVNCQLLIADIKKSIELILTSGVDFEFRTTVVPGVHDKEVLLEMAEQLQQFSPSKPDPALQDNLAIQQFSNLRWYLQQFLPQNCLDPKFTKTKPYSKEQMEGFLLAVKKIVPNVILRGI